MARSQQKSSGRVRRYLQNLAYHTYAQHWVPLHRYPSDVIGDYLAGRSEGDGAGWRDKLSIAFNRRQRLEAENMSVATGGGTVFDKDTKKATKCDLQLSGSPLKHTLNLINGRLVGPQKLTQFRRILKSFDLIRTGAALTLAWVVGFMESDGGFILAMARNVNGDICNVRPKIVFTQKNRYLLDRINAFIPGGHVDSVTSTDNLGKTRTSSYKLVYSSAECVSTWLRLLRCVPLQGLMVEQYPIISRAHEIRQTRPGSRLNADELEEVLWLKSRLRRVRISDDRRWNFHVSSWHRTRTSVTLDQMVIIDRHRRSHGKRLTYTELTRLPGCANLSRTASINYDKRASEVRRLEESAVRGQEREVLDYVRHRARCGATPVHLVRELGSAYPIWTRLLDGSGHNPDHHAEACAIDFSRGYAGRGWLGQQPSWYPEAVVQNEPFPPTRRP